MLEAMRQEFSKKADEIKVNSPSEFFEKFVKKLEEDFTFVFVSGTHSSRECEAKLSFSEYHSAVIKCYLGCYPFTFRNYVRTSIKVFEQRTYIDREKMVKEQEFDSPTHFNLSDFEVFYANVSKRVNMLCKRYSPKNQPLKLWNKA